MSFDIQDSSITGSSAISETPEKDFYRVLDSMLRAHDDLEDDLPIEKYPHATFVSFFTERLKYLQSKNKLTAIEYLKIPFEIANGTRNGIDQNIKNTYSDYIDHLISTHRNNTKDQIKEHLTSLKELKNASRVYDFETYPDWQGWDPSTWKEYPNKWNEHLDDFKNIAKEFKFSHSIAQFASLCKAQKEQEPAKEKILSFYLKQINYNDIHNCDSPSTDELKELKNYLHEEYHDQDYTFLEKNIKFFSPYYLDREEVNTFFKWAICSCVVNRNQPHLPFFKKIWLLGKLYNIHYYPINFFDYSGSRINDELFVKIKVLREYLLKKDITYPIKTYDIEDDLSKKILFLKTKFPISLIIKISQNLHIFDKAYDSAQASGNKDVLDSNKQTINQAKSSISILDWIDNPLTRSTDKAHRLFALIVKALCIYNTDPTHYNKKLLEMGPLLLSKILSLKQAIDQDSKKTNPIFDDKNINDIIVSEIFAILGLTERFIYTIKENSKINIISQERIIFVINFITDDKYSSILNFRERFLWGNILKHPKIIRFITSLDFETNTRWYTYLGEFSSKFLPIVNRETINVINETQNMLNTINRSNLSDSQQKDYDESLGNIQKNKKLIQFSDKLNNLKEQLESQQAKKDLEKNNT